MSKFKRTVNPATGEGLTDYMFLDADGIEKKLRSVARETAAWRTTTLDRRAKLLRDLALRIRSDAAQLALLITDEMGKPLTESRAELEKCAAACEHYAEHGPAMLAEVPVMSNAVQSYVAYRPLGAVLAVMPWNFPFWQVIRFAAPAIMAGNVGVLKHAPNVAGCALALERLILEAGAPEGVFTNLFVEDEAVAELIADARIHAVTLTGSERAGAAVAAQAGRALKKTVLELGGSDAFIICADADLDRAAEMAVKSRFQNAGQSCIAAKRFIVDRRIYDDFLERFTQHVAALRVGQPRESATQIGPLARFDLRDIVHAQVMRSIAAGARLVCGGGFVNGPGAFYAPTVLADVHRDMPCAQEEVFGPVAVVMPAQDVEDAVDIANSSPYGLGGNLWTRDLDRAKRIAARLESGGVFINGMTASDPRLPFGGVKRSGYGRELSHIGMHEFMNVQTIWVGNPYGPS